VIDRVCAPPEQDQVDGGGVAPWPPPESIADFASVCSLIDDCDCLVCQGENLRLGRGERLRLLHEQLRPTALANLWREPVHDPWRLPDVEREDRRNVTQRERIFLLQQIAAVEYHERLDHMRFTVRSQTLCYTSFCMSYGVRIDQARKTVLRGVGGGGDSGTLRGVRGWVGVATAATCAATGTTSSRCVACGGARAGTATTRSVACAESGSRSGSTSSASSCPTRAPLSCRAHHCHVAGGA